jgi:hypothetical protein
MTDDGTRFVTPSDMMMMALARAGRTAVRRRGAAALAMTQADIVSMFGFGLPAARIVVTKGEARGDGKAYGVRLSCHVTLRREADRERQQRHRERLARGGMLCPVEADGDTIDAMVALGWLGEWDSENPTAVGEAIRRLAEAALGFGHA